ncbi:MULTISPECIES: alpha/beta hydrolase [unclassified Arthrobacter]|uniref:alpha/beta hydrolase n=1 Tax=unclassified Arthrobacter TaxID=235627 RepID=UPI002DFF450F|nr:MULTISPECIES: alpha/beta hydrolase-fold protein [unclassified Arthrobacter]MEC5191651.1 S-formylglutathione hydrolase FrmB [Arthrobacter sp. MP_M4]MEC5203342.1 S-formylglutathione hydrolase FrmB [Arthrobacter sp. MP_M7]
MDFLEDLRIVDGPVLLVAWAAGAAGFFYFLRQGGRFRTRTPAGPRWLALVLPVAVCLLCAAGLLAGAHWTLIYLFSVFPGELPPEVLAWSLPGVTALLLWILHLWRTWRGAGRTDGRSGLWRSVGTTAVSTAALFGVVLLSAVQINAYFGLNHTVSDLTGTAVARIPPLEDALRRASGGAPGSSLSQWVPPADLPDGGVLRRAAIPGTSSGFQSREAYIYLPPAYLSASRPALPVLVLFAGQPGAPADWLTGGALRSRLDRFAAEHHGVAPVVVVVDPNGSSAGNTLCMDSRIAQADTFLAVDVPAWINRTLEVDPDPRLWAAGGFSFGATCAVQMVTRHPDVYSSALAFSSEREPALAKERDKTIAAAFGGDVEAFERQTPLRLMMDRRFDGDAIYFGAGERDPEFVGYMDVLSAAARDAGFTVATRRIAGAGHSWETGSKGLPSGLEFLASRWGITQ